LTDFEIDGPAAPQVLLIATNAAPIPEGFVVRHAAECIDFPFR
jgi:hypothetical protein